MFTKDSDLGSRSRQNRQNPGYVCPLALKLPMGNQLFLRRRSVQPISFGALWARLCAVSMLCVYACVCVCVCSMCLCIALCVCMFVCVCVCFVFVGVCCCVCVCVCFCSFLACRTHRRNRNGGALNVSSRRGWAWYLCTRRCWTIGRAASQWPWQLAQSVAIFQWF